MAKSDLRIDILGTSITISTDEEPEYLNMLLEKYRGTIENVQRISGLKDPLKAAVLTGFLLCDDLEKAGTVRIGEKERGEAEQITLGMISRLDAALKVSDLEDLSQSRKDTEDAERNPLPEDSSSSLCASAPLRDDESGNNVPHKAPCAFYKLQNTIKNYDWGSPEWIPALLGQENPSRLPWAELWMGANPAGPSRVTLPGESETSLLLSELIEQDRTAFLGKETAENFGKLPFLFKVEAAAKPLSIQAHPNLRQAQEGFERENREGIPLDAPNRNYRDCNHKPEISCALGPFVVLCGFREAKKASVLIATLLSEIYSGGIYFADGESALKSSLESLISALEQSDENPFKAFLESLFSLNAQALQALGSFIKSRQPLLERKFPQYKDEWYLCSYLSGLYPGDPGIIAPLYLNIIELAPGEAMYLPAGVLHAYIHGMGIELMADSDNVLRGGLTSKHVDVKELLNILDYSEYRPEILKLPEPAPAWYSYPAPAGEFTLSVMHSRGGSVAYPGGNLDPGGPRTQVQESGPSIVIVTQGCATVTENENGDEMILNTGESVFIPAREKANLKFSGIFTAYVAAAPAAPDHFKWPDIF